MILLDQAAGTTPTSPDMPFEAPKGRQTLIILERDGSLRHYPPGQAHEEHRHARVDLDVGHAQPSIIDKILDFTFDVLGISNLEVRVHEHPKR